MPKPSLLLLASLLLGCFPCLGAESADPSAIRGEVTWSGEVTVKESVTVESGATLVLAPGTRVTFEEKGTLSVRGHLKAIGQKTGPIRLQGSPDSRLYAISTEGEASRLELVEVEMTGAYQAIEVRSGSITAKACRFQQNNAALSIDAKGRAELSDLVFDSNDAGLTVAAGSKVQAARLTFRNHKVGLVLESGAAGSFEDCSFAENANAVGDERSSTVTFTRCSFTRNETAMDLRRTDKGPVVSKSTFLNNKKGISASLSSNPLLDACQFRDNEIALEAEGFCNPFLRYCTFTGNGQAVRFVKKSNGLLEGNRLEKNKVALFADFASYPTVRGNLFLDNEWHVRLGNEQSVDFERQRGSVDLTSKGAKDKAQRGPAAPSLPPPLRPGVVSVVNEIFSVAENAWDDETEREMRAGPGANISRFWDGRDQEPVSYKGFGDGKYAVDVISFLPSVTREQVRVGPEAWEPYVPKRPARSPSGTPAPNQEGPRPTIPPNAQ